MKMFFRFSKLAVVALLGLVFCTSAFAQFRSAIEGTVTDSSGAVVPDAKVTLTNVDTGVSTSTQSNGEGLFRFPSLPPGRYRVSVTKQGFATTTQENITLLAEEIRTVSLALKAGAATEIVTVSAEANPIQLTEAKVAGDISAQEISQLPLPGRNIGSLISFTPGVTGTANASRNANDTDIFSLVNNPQVNANGQRGEANMFYLDNTLATSNPDPGVYNLTPNPESVQELHVTVNDYSAEYGRGSSLIIQAVTKGGTNQFHGSLFEYHQDNKLSAANFFDAGFVPVFRRNEFGGSIGGPFLKNKLFGFFSYDQKRASRPTTLSYTLETQDFVNFMKSNFPDNLSTQLMTKFPATVGNVIPGSTQTVQDLDPNCVSQAPVAGISCSLNVRERTNLPVAVRDNGLQWNTRVDFTPSSKDRFYGNFYRKTPDVLSPNPRPAFDQLNNFAGITNYANLDWTRTISPSLVNDAAIGVTRISGLGSCSNCQVPGIFGSGLADFGDGFSPAEFIQNDFEWRDLLSYNHGKHAMKFGLDIFRDQENDLFDGPTQRPGYIFFGTNVPGIFNFANDNVQLQPGINFDLRTGALSQQSIGFRSTNFSFFGQDDWKVKPNFSLNLGLRWDFNTSPNEQAGRTSSILLGSGSTLMQKIAGASVGIVPSLMPNHSIAYFAPRVSFAWDPTKQGKLSIRGGLGVFYERPPNIFWSDAVRSNPPFIASVTADSTNASAPQPVYGLCPNDHTPFNCPIPPPSQLPTGLNARGGSIACCSSIGGVDPATKQAYTISRFGGVQYSFTPNWMVEADYTGSLSIHQYVRTDRNVCVGCYDPVTGVTVRPNPFFNAIAYGDNSGWAKYNGFTASVLHRFSQSFVFQVAYTVGKTTSVVDAPGLGRDSLLAPVYDPYNINAQVGPASFDVPHAFTMHGLWELPKLKGQNAAVRAVLGSWQLSGTTSLQGGYPYTVVDCNDSPTGPNSGGPCLLPDVTASGKGTSCGKSGWLNGCISSSSFSLPASCQYVQTASSTNQNDPNPNPFVLNCSSGQFVGNVGRNSLRGPGYADVDMSLGRLFHIPWFTHEGARLQVRGEFFNLFNRVNLNLQGNPTFNPALQTLAFVPGNLQPIPGGNGNTALGSPTNTSFGTATGAFFARTLQVGARIEF
jgi:carboxypeptidase family protein/TonB-dependent receptor-like protein